MRRVEGPRGEATVAIFSDLAVTTAAVRLLIDDPSIEHVVGDIATYVTGFMPSTDPSRPHRVVLGWADEAGALPNSFAISRLMRSHPGVEVVVLCGLAAGVHSAEVDVQLGDVVVATDGIVDYEHVGQVEGSTGRPDRRLSDVSPILRQADREVAVQELGSASNLPPLIERAESAWPSFRRPEARRPRIHRGTVGSSGRLLRDVRQRDSLATRYGLLAFEMEGAGIATGAELGPQGWLAVRGISDYGGPGKDDSWHASAALAAAAYTRVLLAACPPLIRRIHPRDDSGRPSSRRLNELVDLLMTLPIMVDDGERRAVLASLPASIRTQLPESLTRRSQIISLVRACERIPDGLAMLLDAVRLAVAPDPVTMRTLSAAVKAYSEPSA